MSSEAAFQPSLFDDDDDHDSTVTGTTPPVPPVAGLGAGPEGSDGPSVGSLVVESGAGAASSAGVWVGGWAAPRPTSARGARCGLGTAAGTVGESGSGGDRGPGARRRRGRSVGGSPAGSAVGGRVVSDVEGEAAADARWIEVQLARAPEPSALMAAAIVTALAPKPARDDGG